MAGWEGGSASPGSSSAVLSGAWRGLSVAAPVPDGTSPSCKHPSRSPNRAASHSPHTLPSPEDPPRAPLSLAGTPSTQVGRTQSGCTPRQAFLESGCSELWEMSHRLHSG